MLPSYCGAPETHRAQRPGRGDLRPRSPRDGAGNFRPCRSASDRRTAFEVTRRLAGLAGGEALEVITDAGDDIDSDVRAWCRTSSPASPPWITTGSAGRTWRWTASRWRIADVHGSPGRGGYPPVRPVAAPTDRMDLRPGLAALASRTGPGDDDSSAHRRRGDTPRRRRHAPDRRAVSNGPVPALKPP